jgi:hypothetical protein
MPRKVPKRYHDALRRIAGHKAWQAFADRRGQAVAFGELLFALGLQSRNASSMA